MASKDNGAPPASPAQPDDDSTLCLCTTGIPGPKRTLRFQRGPAPAFHEGAVVCYVRPFSIRKSRGRHWLIPRRAACVLLWLGVITFIAGLISLQIGNIVKHSMDAGCYGPMAKVEMAAHRLSCPYNRREDIVKLEQKVIPIGIICMGFGGTMLLLSAFLFFHAYCVVYEGSEDVVALAEKKSDRAMESTDNISAGLTGSQFFTDNSKRPTSAGNAQTTGKTLTVPSETGASEGTSRKHSIISFSPPVHVIRAQQQGGSPSPNGRRVAI